MIVIFFAGVFLLPESKYPRQRGIPATGHDHTNSVNGVEELNAPIRIQDRPALDFQTYAPRGLVSDLRLFVNRPDWGSIAHTIYQMGKFMLFPTVLWCFVLNGTALGAMISISATQAGILIAPPYAWSPNSISYVNAGQIVVSIVAIPLLG